MGKTTVESTVGNTAVKQTAALEEAREETPESGENTRAHLSIVRSPKIEVIPGEKIVSSEEATSAPALLDDTSEKSFFDTLLKTIAEEFASWREYVNQIVAAEISEISRYCDATLQLGKREEDTGLLLEAVNCEKKLQAKDIKAINRFTRKTQSRAFILLNSNINHDERIEDTLTNIQKVLNRHSRVGLVIYNPYFRGLYALANFIGIRTRAVPSNFVTLADLTNIAKLSGLEIVRTRRVVFSPFRMFGLGNIINRILPAIPIISSLSLVTFVVLRPLKIERGKPSLTVVIPARNQEANIEKALKRMPSFKGAKLEILFVEGHSTDNTWGEIQRVAKKYKKQFSIKSFQHTGKGKADAVRLGFQKAKGELLTLLDADLSVSPEALERFYQAYRKGHADFINGTRLIYPMERKGLSLMGNVLLSKVLSFVLGNPHGDSLCETKLFPRKDYARCMRWCDDFGDFDPFGDLELLFPASVLALGTVDVPIRLQNTTSGSDILDKLRDGFLHGFLLLKMAMIGLLRVKSGRI